MTPSSLTPDERDELADLRQRALISTLTEREYIRANALRDREEASPHSTPEDAWGMAPPQIEDSGTVYEWMGANRFVPVKADGPEHRALRLSKAEREELAALNDAIVATALDPEKRARWKALNERALLYGCEGVEARTFVGLEPRHAR